MKNILLAGIISAVCANASANEIQGEWKLVDAFCADGSHDVPDLISSISRGHGATLNFGDQNSYLYFQESFSRNLYCTLITRFSYQMSGNGEIAFEFNAKEQRLLEGESPRCDYQNELLQEDLRLIEPENAKLRVKAKTKKIGRFLEITTEAPILGLHCPNLSAVRHVLEKKNP